MTAPADNMNMAEVIPPIEEGLFRFREDGAPVLTGAVCPSCDRPFFPAPEACPDCGAVVERADLGSSGVIYSQTTIRSRPPFGLPQPYSVAFLDLDAAPLRIFVLLDPDEAGNFRIGDRVLLRVAPIGHDGTGEPRLRPYFSREQV